MNTPASLFEPSKSMTPLSLRGKSIFAPAAFNATLIRVARIEPDGLALAPLLASSSDLANMLARVCLAYSFGTDAEQARAIFAAETLLTVLGHPLTKPGEIFSPTPLHRR